MTIGSLYSCTCACWLRDLFREIARPTCQSCCIVHTTNGPNVFEDPALLAQGEKVSDAGGAFLLGMIRRSEPDEHQTVRAGVGERKKEHRVDEAEHQRNRAHAP